MLRLNKINKRQGGKKEQGSISFLRATYLVAEDCYILSSQFFFPWQTLSTVSVFPDFSSRLVISFVNLLHLPGRCSPHFLGSAVPKAHSLSGQDLPIPNKQKELLFFPSIALFTHLIKIFAFVHQYESVKTFSLWVTVTQLHLCSSAAHALTTQTIPVHFVFLPKHETSHLSG